MCILSLQVFLVLLIKLLVAISFKTRVSCDFQYIIVDAMATSYFGFFLLLILYYDVIHFISSCQQ